ncbi:hypothetical protein GOODEAATRI_005114 [Goodea atripinnis]|uniref:Ig-like domain-containing protein n=1 Tax=Goodea atripinnis TaxID=208336 RepID=A0ABV0NVC1_9TELE
MVPSTVREASGLYTIKSVLYMQPTKADKDSLFHCTVEYSLAGEQNKNIQMTSEPMKIELYYPSEKVMFDLLNATKVKEGDDVTIKCETDGNPQPSFEFLKDDKPLNGKDGLLTLKSVKRTDSGRYFCTAFDFDHLDIELKAEKVLDVNYIDQMSVTPIGHQVVMLGNKVEWQCKTKASKSHTVQWKKHFSIPQGSTVLSQDGTLSIESVTYDNAGGYLCVGAVPDVPGLTSQASVNLTVKVEDNKVVSTVTLQATPDIMKDGVTCEVSNEHGKDSKTLLVTVNRGQSTGQVNNIVVEMKTEKANEEAGLLNKKVNTEQVRPGRD